MTFEEVAAILDEVRWGETPSDHGRQLYDFVLRTRPRDIVELGSGVGISSCYMAAALEELGGGGKITTIDRDPNLPDFIRQTYEAVNLALLDRLEIRTVETSYNDELMRLIETQTTQSESGICEPCFDFCFLDGAHTWADDGLAFFLVEKLLRPGGWILFDDMSWIDPEGLPEWLAEVPQVTRVFELLVAQHPGFDELAHVDDWGWARKRPTQDDDTALCASDIFTAPTLREEATQVGRKVLRRLGSKLGLGDSANRQH